MNRPTVRSQFLRSLLLPCIGANAAIFSVVNGVLNYKTLRLHPPESSAFSGILRDMSMFKVNVVARNPKPEELATLPVEALVDTGSELTWLPSDLLKSAGITPRRRRVFATATQQKVEREVGYAILSSEGYETNDEVVFAEPGDMTLLGIRTLEGFGVMVDNVGHHFVATTTIVAPRNAIVRTISASCTTIDRGDGCFSGVAGGRLRFE
jgi:predicted aspartyl protease